MGSPQEIDTKDDRFQNVKTGDDQDEWLRSLKGWSGTMGKPYPYQRKSISALLKAREGLHPLVQG
jgi:hypothetical protein